jgi:hypothetical protein
MINKKEIKIDIAKTTSPSLLDNALNPTRIEQYHKWILRLLLWKEIICHKANAERAVNSASVVFISSSENPGNGSKRRSRMMGFEKATI